MSEAITKISCDIIQFGWSTDRALVDTFIMGLAACIRDRNNQEDQVFCLAFTLAHYFLHSFLSISFSLFLIQG